MMLDLRSRSPRPFALTALILGALLPAVLMAAPSRIELDPGTSEIGFLMHTTWHDVEGKTKSLSGAIASESGDIFTDGRVSVEIEAAGLDTGNGRRDRTMRESHLETAKYPRISFVSTVLPIVVSSVADAGGAPREVSLTVRGDLTIHGTTHDVTLPVLARREGGAWILSGEVPVRLSEYSIPDPSMILNRVQDEVRVSFTLRTKPPAP